jgi:hypothetical protein
VLIIVAGPYSAPTEEERRENLARMEEAAAQVFHKGHIPVIGMNAAMPIVERARPKDHYAAIMAISLAIAERCDAILLIGESPGANRERDVLLAQGKPVYRALSEIPPA